MDCTPRPMQNSTVCRKTVRPDSMIKILHSDICSVTFTVGANADSAYEYFLKQWLLSNRTETRLRDMCECYM
jgi:hypothetical protein